jgi:NADPH2:quinone reductase
VPADGQLGIAVRAAGVNYADTHRTEDTYLHPTRLPYVPGVEVVGTTADGRRLVALLGGGGYAQRVAADPRLAFPVPDEISDTAALAMILQGITAWHLLRTSAHLRSGDRVVVHAAGGGVGTVAIQLARLWGASRVIAAASSEDKRALALELGADAVIDSAAEDLTGAIEDAADGKVDVVLEMVGGTVFDASLAALGPFGRLVTFGNAARVEPGPVRPADLLAESRAVIGFWLRHCFARPGDWLRPQLEELWNLIAAGDLRAIAGGSYPLSQARRAHEDLRARGTVGKLVLDPDR